MNAQKAVAALALAAAALGLLSPARAAAEWLPATVELSDGTRIEGAVGVPNDALLIYNEARRRRYTVRLAEISSLLTAIEWQGMAEKWIFRESGSDEKIYTGRYYPVRHYLATITFNDGKQLSGRIMPKTLYVKSEGKTRRFILRAKQEGKVGQKLSDLLYVRRITFGGAGAGTRATIRGTLDLPEGEKLQKVLALNRDKLFSIEAKIEPAAGKFRLADCTEGAYDLAVVTNKALYVYFSREKDKGATRLDAPSVAGMQAWVDGLRDFFHKQAILYAAGNEKGAFALVCSERHGGTTLPGAALVRRYDIWAMRKPGEAWQIQKRFFLWRQVSKDPALARRALVIAPALGGHRVEAGSSDLSLSIKLRHNSEKPIPPARPKAKKAPSGAPAAPKREEEDGE